MNSRMWMCAAVTALVLAGVCQAANTIEKTVTISAGKVDRVETPITITVDIPEALAKSAKGLAATLTPGTITGQVVVAQDGKTATVTFIAPTLKAGASATLKLTVATNTGANQTDVFAFGGVKGKREDITFRGKTVLRYMCEYDEAKRHDTYKVYHHVFDSAGKSEITKGAGGKFTHHRGIFMGWSRTRHGADKFDTWHMKPGSTNQLHQETLENTGGPVFGRHTLLIHWTDPSGKAVIAEERTLTVFRQSGTAKLIQFNSTLNAIDGDVTLDGDPEHAGFQYRPHNDAAAKTSKLTKYHFRDDAKIPKGGGKGFQDQDWVGMSYTLNDTRYNVLYVPHPDNPEKPIWSTYRDYGRFGSYFKHELKEGKPLKIKYRIWITEGDDAPSKDRFEQVCADFIDPPKVTVK